MHTPGLTNPHETVRVHTAKGEALSFDVGSDASMPSTWKGLKRCLNRFTTRARNKARSLRAHSPRDLQKLRMHAVRFNNSLL
jgi:hypothetical protein